MKLTLARHDGHHHHTYKQAIISSQRSQAAGAALVALEPLEHDFSYEQKYMQLALRVEIVYRHEPLNVFC